MSRPTHVSALIAQYLTDLHGKQRTEKDKRRVEDVIDSTIDAGNVTTIKRGRRA